MNLYSTNSKSQYVGLKKAVLNSYPKDKGLYMPSRIDRLPDSFLKKIKEYSIEQIAFELSRHLFKEVISDQDLESICSTAINFPAPVVALNDQLNSLELFHGPSLAFKDFGARYMAQLMSYFLKGDKQELTILVATSGDTGGAVASGFLGVPGIRVVILYPKDRVSPLQERQLTTLGQNIHTCQIDGSFDDCQRLVKTAFLDFDLSQKFNLGSANSINIARLIPQTFYYFEALKQLDLSKKNYFCVPSGNFGNLTAGVIAHKMGLNVDGFIAATNLNNVVPEFLKSGKYQTKESISTISNAMDVGAPSNFVRLMDLFDGDLKKFRSSMHGYYFDDSSTLEEMKDLYQRFNYVADPHGAVGFLAAKEFLKKSDSDTCITILETAHPCKFDDVVFKALGLEIDMPDRVKSLFEKEMEFSSLPKSFEKFKEYLLSNSF